MKVSKDQKRKNFESLLKAATKLAQDKDFISVPMRAIATEAGLSEAAIYNYFPTKESLLTGYLDWSMEKAFAQAKGSNRYESLSFSEKLHTLIEAHLEILEPDRNFVSQIFSQLFVQSIPMSQSHLKETRARYVALLESELDRAVTSGEFEDPPLRGLICELLWDFHVGVIYYWLRDNSAGRMGTTQLIDLSLNIFNELLRGGIMNKAYSLVHFLMKEHVLNKLFTAAKL